MEIIYKERTTRLKVILAKKGYTQADLASLTGIQRYQISQICSGRRTNIYLDTARKIASALEVTLDEAFGD
jgi:transcriptional regulator with XRE-family HTH domain